MTAWFIGVFEDKTLTFPVSFTLSVNEQIKMSLAMHFWSDARLVLRAVKPRSMWSRQIRNAGWADSTVTTVSLKANPHLYIVPPCPFHSV